MKFKLYSAFNNCHKALKNIIDVSLKKLWKQINYVQYIIYVLNIYVHICNLYMYK